VPDRQTSYGAVVPCRALLLLLLVPMSQACETTFVTPVDIDQVEVVPSAITLLEGEREAFSAILKETSGEALDGAPVIWTVDDPEVASVAADGVVQALTAGSTLLRASLGDVSGTAALRVLRLDQEQGPGCEIRSNSISGDLRIPPNTRCMIRDVYVSGHLRLEAGASVTGTGVRVDGNVEAKHAEELTLTDALIFGDLKFEDGGSVTLRESHVGGKVELKSNVGSIELLDNVIEHDGKLERNRAGPFRLVGNTVDGKLECKDNEPAPSGSGNVAKHITGQCSGL
jgi:hypothetical protein